MDVWNGQIPAKTVVDADRNKYDCEFGKHIRAVETADKMLQENNEILRRIADRVFGSPPPSDQPAQPKAVPSGLSDELTDALCRLADTIATTQVLAQRLSKLA